ncbi:MAG: dipeptidase [Ignavibacteria bacterium]|nr:MAG: dipeptidase [Ignavibacteria bacterium]
MKEVVDYLKSNQDRFLEELADFIKIPSISAHVENRKDMVKTAKFVEKQLRAAGLKNVKQYPTKGNPVVYGEWMGAKGAPTVLVYGHYDVQPVEPLEKWKTEPFTMTIKGGKMFARGTADDKGQAFIHFKVIEAYLKTYKKLPVNVKVIIEGEEEIGSPNLVEFIKKHRALLKCDTILISDTNMLGKTKPSITYGLRGLTYLEVTVTSLSGDQHSGTYGGGVANPAQVLAELLVGCKDPKTSKIKIPGFYEDVVPLSRKERAELAKIPHDDMMYAKGIGAVNTFGEKGYSTIERTGARPTFEINGIWSGHTGAGVKTVLPATAHAKVSMRLVANQDPDKIAKLFKDHIKSITPDTVKVDVKLYENNGYAALTPLDADGMKAASVAIKKVYKKEPFFTREGGSIPVVADFQHLLGVEAILLGFGLPDDNLHAPNEKMDISQFKNGLITTAHFLEEYAKIKK